jgi:cytochrome b subunit of formate dehydrogenase
MNPFHYAKNFFSDGYLPQQLTWAFGLFLLSLVVVMAGVVLMRRAYGAPRRSAKGALPPPGSATFERYEVGARLWHFGLFGMLLVLWISGFAFYAPGIVPGSLPFGVSWLFVHLAFGALFIIGILGHSAISMGHGDPRSMWFDRRDSQELAAAAQYYLGKPHEVPKLGKYGVWNKVFHAALILLALIMIVSGISLSMGSLGWVEIDQNWQRQQRLLHDFGSYGFLALVVAHVFWQILKGRSQLKSMVIGTIPADTFRSNHDWDRWKPHAVSQTADTGKVDHAK